MVELCFVTHNRHKVIEVSQMLGESFRILSLDDIGFPDDIPEDKPTLEGNSLVKARTIYQKYHISSFADDTGLEVAALNNEPGVRSARYAGDQQNSEENIRLLLHKLKNVGDRKARFRTVITLFLDHNPRQFEGIIYGNITDRKIGDKGFGYDPIFLPQGYKETFAQLSLQEKNKISHRGIAFRKMVHYLQQKSSSGQ
jgi:XTP/dITP diphosphohydrolase